MYKMLQKRKGMRETEDAKIDEQSSPEGKKILTGKELRNETTKWQENGAITL